jgi:glutathione S-transferase
MAHAIRIHRHPLSGHAHRVELFAGLAGIAHELVDVDLLNGEHRKAPFLSLNPFGEVPVIEDGAVVLADSNAILVYLAKTYAPDWLPETAEAAARVQRFLSIAAGPLRNGPANARLVTVFGVKLDAAQAKAIADQILGQIDTHLADRDWLAGDTPSIADVAIYSYSAHAPEGNVSLEPFANLRAWLQRVEALEGFIPMQASKAGLTA